MTDTHTSDERYQEAQRALKEAQEELALQAWGLTKTNEAIKTLYKELERKNKELQQLDQLKSDFISTVSHELRTPLTTIREVISQLLEGIHGPTTPSQTEFLSMCLEDVDRLKRIIDDLLDVSKIEAGKFKLHKATIDLVGLVKGVGASFRPRVEALGLDLRMECSNEEMLIWADRDSIIRVFTNLIGNALKFTARGHVGLSVNDTPEGIECRVSDTGRGIAEEDLPRLFGKFQQFGRLEGGGEKGTGLGLNISKNIVELHGGKMWVESTLGAGTTFIFTLPKYSAEKIFEEELAERIKDVITREAALSVAIFCIRGTGSSSGQTPRPGFLAIQERLKDIAGRNVRRDTDLLIAGAGALALILPATDKARAGEVAERLVQQAREADKDLHGQMCGDPIYSVLSYPDDEDTQEGFLARIASAIAEFR